MKARSRSQRASVEKKETDHKTSQLRQIRWLAHTGTCSNAKIGTCQYITHVHSSLEPEHDAHLKTPYNS